MRIEEAEWIAKKISDIEGQYTSILNIGSSTKHFREVVQPHIDNIVFKPLIKKQISVVHCDIKEDVGVDLVGDILTPQFAKVVKDKAFKVVLCSNVLEHISNYDEFCSALEYIMPVDGFLIITVPNIYPYHKDPIDTKFRPDVTEVANLFKNCKIVHGDVLKSHENHFQAMLKEPYTFFLTVKNWLIPRFGIQEWKYRLSDIKNVFKKYQMTCVLLQKK